MSIVKTTEEFSTRRKVRYGAGRGDSPLKSYSLSSSTALSPHKTFFAEDISGNTAYFIEFNIGEFQFDEITIRTEGQRLIVQGKSKVNDKGGDELSRDFKRDFTLPSNVDPYSIKAQLDEATRVLSLIGQLVPLKSTSAQNSAPISSQESANLKVGSIRENRASDHIEYEIYLGNELQNGQPNIELNGYNNLVIRVNSKNWDTHGDYDFQLTRQIKLPTNADAHQISHGIDIRRSLLLIKLPLKSVF
jgi:HSP20 family molecular chaperone IbpA